MLHGVSDEAWNGSDTDPSSSASRRRAVRPGTRTGPASRCLPCRPSVSSVPTRLPHAPTESVRSLAWPGMAHPYAKCHWRGEVPLSRPQDRAAALPRSPWDELAYRLWAGEALLVRQPNRRHL